MVGIDPARKYPETFRKAVEAAFKQLGLGSEPVIDRPKRGMADLCIVCFPIAKELKCSPEQAASKIMSKMPPSDLFTLEITGGYLNCSFDRKRFSIESASHLWEQGERLGLGPPRDEKVIVEHTSANPNGPFHVGRARNPILGDTLVRLMRAAGYQVEAQYWVNEMGKQAMVLVYGIFNIDPASLPPSEREKEDHKLVRFYQAANSLMESDPAVELEINAMLKRYEEAVAAHDWERPISSEGAPRIRASDVKAACERVLQGMKGSLAEMNVRMDSFVYESKVVEDGSLLGVVEGLKKSPLFREEGGAYYLDLSGFIEGGDEDRFRKRFVFTRSDGSALYTTRDLAYHQWKLSQCDRAINVLGEDHRYQSLQLSLALKELGERKLPEAMFYSFVSLPEGKMSTRRGRVVYLDDLLDEAVQRAMEEVRKRRDDLDQGELERISRAVGIGALRFNVIRVQPEKQIVFKWEDALNFEGAAAPFVQYSHARACSIVKRSGDAIEGMIDWGKLVEASELGLVIVLSRLGPTIEEGAFEKRMHLVASYLTELASAFNDFYRDCPVITEPDPARRKARLALTVLSRRALFRGLDCLGIEAPETM